MEVPEARSLNLYKKEDRNMLKELGRKIFTELLHGRSYTIEINSALMKISPEEWFKIRSEPSNCFKCGKEIKNEELCYATGYHDGEPGHIYCQICGPDII